MYQFNTMFEQIGFSTAKKTYRWHGLASGILLGWLPAWALLHWTSLSAWFFPLAWAAQIPLGYFLGKLIRKKP